MKTGMQAYIWCEEIRDFRSINLQYIADKTFRLILARRTSYTTSPKVLIIYSQHGDSLK